MILNKKLGIALIFFSLVSFLSSIIITLYGLSLHFLVLSCSVFVAFFTIGFFTLILEGSKRFSKSYSPRAKALTVHSDYDSVEDRLFHNRNANERIAVIRDEVLETIKKIKEMELEE